MGAPRIVKFVNNTAVASSSNLITTTQVSPTIISTGFPTGDLLMRRLDLRLSGSLNLAGANPAGAVRARGGLGFLRSLKLETDKHTTIMDGLDGVTLGNMQYIKTGQRPVNQDAGSAANGTPSFEYHLSVPFYDPRGARPEDTYLDMYASRMTLTALYGVVSDFITGGTYTTENVGTYNQETSVDYEPGPVNVGADGPLFQPFWTVRKETISSTTKQYQISLPYGDRLYKRIYIFQRNGSTGAELANTIVGANDNDRLTLRINGGVALYDNVEWLALQDRNASDYGIPAMPTGGAVLDFVPERSGGAKLSDALNVIANQNGLLDLFIDVTNTATTDQLWVVSECVKPINPSAQRPVQAAPGK